MAGLLWAAPADAATALALTNPGTQNGTVGVAVTFKLTATGGTTPYAWTATALPAGLTISGSTGTITGTPTAAATYSTKVTVTDAASHTASASFSWVTAAKVSVTNPGTRTGTIGSSTSLTLSAKGGVTPYTWSATGLPAGLTLNTSTGVVSGTPTATATYTVKVTATDAGKRTGTTSFSWVTATKVTLTNPGTQASNVGQAVSLTLKASGGAPPYAWTATGLPAGLAINASTGVVSGTPTTTAVVSTTVTVKDTAGRSASATFSWGAAVAPTVTNPGTQAGSIGTAVSLTMAASGGATPYTWSASGLPAGLKISSSTGAVTGKPTTAGTYTVKVTAKDTTARTGTATFTWAVTAPVTVTTNAPWLYATAGYPASAQATASGGDGHYTWSATGLPPGLSIDAATGAISGTVTDPGFDWGFLNSTITARDGSGRTGSATLGWDTGRLLRIRVDGTGYPANAVGIPKVIIANLHHDVGAYHVLVIDETSSNAIIGDCGGAADSECDATLNYKITGTHLFYAEVANPDGSDVQFRTPEVSVDLPTAWTSGLVDLFSEDTYPSLGRVDSVHVQAITSQDMGPSPYYLEIKDVTSGVTLASCGGGEICEATIPKSLAADRFIAQVTNHVYPYTSIYLGTGGYYSFDPAWIRLWPTSNGFHAVSNRRAQGDWVLYDWTAQRMMSNWYDCNYSNQYWWQENPSTCDWSFSSGVLDPTHVYAAVQVRADNQCPQYGCSPSQFLVVSNGAMAAPPTPVRTVTEVSGGQNPAEPQSQACTCDPVNTATGEFFEPATDLGLPGAGPALRADRTYSSTYDGVDGPLGYGWAFGYGAHLTVSGTGVQVTQENGSTVGFVPGTTAGQYVAPAQVFATLTYDATTQTYTYTRRAREVLTFDASGRLTAVRDLHGNAVTLAYDGNGLLSTASASGGRTLSFAWTGAHLSRVADSAGRAVAYAYDGAGNLVSVTGVDGGVTTYGYDGAHELTTVTKPGGGMTTNVYDAQGRVVSQTDPVGRTTTIAYAGTPGASTTTTVTAPDGTVSVDSYYGGLLTNRTRASGTDEQQSWTYYRDAAGDVTTMVDPLNRTTTYTYDGQGDETSQTDALGRRTTWTYDALGDATSVQDPMGRTVSSTFDAGGDRLSSTSATGRVQRWAYDADGTVQTATDPTGAVTRYAYDAAGRPTSVTDPDGRVTSTGYDAAGNPVSTTDPAGNTTRATVDAAGRVRSSTDPDGRTVRYTYDADGNRRTVTGPSGAVSASAYDAAGELTAVTDAAGATTTRSYTPNGYLASVTDPAGQVTSYGYDALGHQTSVTDPDGRVTTSTYDGDGRLLSTTLPSGATTRRAYDAAGEQTSVIDAAGQTTTNVYDQDGELIVSDDPLGQGTVRSYTGDGQLDTETFPDGSTQVHRYDAAGRPVSVTDRDGYATTYAYDAAGLPTSRTQPGGLVTSFSYDAAGRPTGTTQPDGTVRTSAYDAAGRLTSVTSTDRSVAPVTYTYDADGRRATITDGTGTTRYAYDATGRITAVTNGAGASVGYTYDAAGHVTSLRYPDGQALGYAYDAAGQLVSATDWAGRTTTFGYTPDGQLATQLDANGVSTSTGYDRNGRTTAITVSGGGATPAAYTYAYDAAGRLTGDANDAGGTGQYRYDALSQLSSATVAPDATGPAATATYAPTPGGRLGLLPDGASLSYTTGGELVSQNPASGPATTYGYDGNGDRTSASRDADAGTPASTLRYGYAGPGVLASVQGTDGTSVGYTADATGLRQSRTENGVARHFTWSVVGALPLLLDDGTHRYLYGPAPTPYAQIDADGTVQYLHTDLVGSVRLITDSAGAAVGRSTFDAYGNRVAHSGTADSAMGYTGNWTDPATGVVYLRSRDLDPATGQFLSVDPAADATHQPYAYAFDNPLQLVDPSGLCSGCSWLDNLVLSGPSNAVAHFLTHGIGGDLVAADEGFADTLTGGLTGDLREAISPGSNCFVNHNGFYYGGAGVALVGMAVLTDGVGDMAALDEGLSGSLELESAGPDATGYPRFVASKQGIIDTQSPALDEQIGDVVDSLRTDGTPPPGVRQGGLPGQPGVYGNRGGDLPPQPEGYYTESDVWPGPGPRGTERIVIGDNGEVWYTPDHYGNFRPWPW